MSEDHNYTEKKNLWYEKTYEKVRTRFPERKSSFATTSGIPIEPIYGPDGEGDYLRDLSFPGHHPYTRGVQPTMYRSRFWTMRQYAGFGTAAESNERYRYLLKQGQKGLSVAFDLPTQMGYDSDDPLCRGEVGKVGVAIDSLADMEMLFDKIPLDKVSTSMTINSTAAILLALYIVVAKKQGVASEQLRGTIQNDILKEYVARGTYIFPPAPSMRIVTDIFAFCQQAVPLWNTISISGYHIREAGSTAVQEVAFTLANGMAYVQAALKAGLDVDTFAARLSFFFNAHNNFLEEVAKFRAARRLWSRIMKDHFKAQQPKSCMLRFHTQTAGCTLTAQQPDNNVVRVTLQALAAVLGGTQSLHTNSRDEALSLPTQESVLLALRTQQLIAHESGVADHIDPLGGSYAIESMTNAIEAGACKYLDQIEEYGGAVKAIEDGFMQREIQDAAYRYQRSIETREHLVVGVNEFTTEKEEPKNILCLRPEVEREQVERLTATKQNRDSRHVKDCLDRVQAAAEGDDNLMPPILEAVEAYASIGEISGRLRQVFGEHREIVVV